MTSSHGSPPCSINGSPIGAPRRPRGGDSRYYDEDIDWLLNEAPALLGERGSGFGEGGGSKTGEQAASGIHDQRIRATDAVERWRRLHGFWVNLSPRAKLILSARYSRKSYWDIRGLKAAFEDLASVALTVTTDRDALSKALSKSSAKQVHIITETRRNAEREVTDAHLEWQGIKREAARKWAEG